MQDMLLNLNLFIYFLYIKRSRKAFLLAFVLQNFISLQSIVIFCSNVLDVFTLSIVLLLWWIVVGKLLS